MLAIQPASLHRAKEELRAIGVRTGIGHRQGSWEGGVAG